jgi:two-component system response regulator (stage 0 sporulation protein F)
MEYEMEMINKESIFVVDDDQGILDSFDVMLGDDYPLYMADNGVDALEFLDRHQPCLMFLDLKMPRMNGLELLKNIAARNLSTTVVVVTALPQDQYEELARQYGVYKYLRKPLDVDEVEDIASVVLH